VGYFSEKAIDDGDSDKSMPEPSFLLKMRLSELSERYAELRITGEKLWKKRILLDEVLKHVLPEHLTSFEEVERAIDLVRWDLFTTYGINTKDPLITGTDEEISCPGQMTLNLYGNKRHMQAA